MPPFTDYLKMGVTKPSSNMIPKKGRSDLTEVSQATPNPVKTIAQGTASTAPLGMNSKIQNLANIPKMSVTKSPFNFTNLIGQQQGGLPNTDFLKMGMQGPTQQGMQEFNTRLDDANTSIKDNKRAFVERVAKGGVITRKEIEEQMSDFDDNKKREFLSVLGQSNAKIEGIDFNNEPKEGFTIGNTDISVNPIKQAGEKILEAKEYLKNNPQADPIMKTLLQGVINTLDQTGLLSIGGSANPVVNALEGYLPKTDNPVTQGLMGFAGNTTRGVGQVIEGGAGLVDKGIAGTQSLVQGGPMDQYQTRQTGIGEDILDVGAGATQSLASVYAMPASLLIGAGIEALPPEGQKAVSDTMTGLGGLIAKTPGLSQWMESLPPERRDEFKTELAGAAIGMLGGLKGKSNIIKNPKLFLQQNLNPVQLAKNFNENVIGIPSKALETAVSTVGKIDLPEVNVPTVKVPKAVSNKVDMVIEQLEGVGKSKKEGIQNNPYSKEIYSKVIEDIDNGNAPQNYKDMQEPYTKKVVEELDTILDDVKSQKGEGGEAFNLLRQDQTPIDTTVEIKSMNDLLKGTDYSLKTFLNRVDKGNLLGTRKILDNTATISTLHDIRKGLDDLMLKAQANKDSGEFKILKNMRKIVDGKLKENPDRVKADEEWARISKDIQEIEEGITYREQRKKGQIRDNIDSIIENINNPAKAKLRERLLQYMPDIGERISAIRGIPEIAKAYTTIPQGVIGRVAGALGGVAIGSTGGIPGMILGGIAGMFADVGLSQLRRNSIKKAIAKQSPKALEKLGEIQQSIANGKKLRADQVIELQNFTNNLKKSLPANDKELISKVSELPKIIKTSLVPVKEGVLESRGYTQKLTSPKREITEINPMAGKKYTAQDLLQEVRAKKTGDKGNNPKIPANTPKELPANKKLSDNLLTKLNNPKKTVQSDTLVSKADSMSKDLQPLYDEAKKYKTAEEFVKAQGTPVYRGGIELSKEKITDAGISVSKGKNVAEDFVKQKGGKVEEIVISPNAKIIDYSDIPNVKFKNLNDYSPELDTGNKQIWRDLEVEYQKAINWAKNNGYDAIRLPLEGETRIVNKDIIKTKSQLTDIWKKANAGNKIDPLINEAKKYKSAEEFIESNINFYHQSQSPTKFEEFRYPGESGYKKASYSTKKGIYFSTNKEAVQGAYGSNGGVMMNVNIQPKNTLDIGEYDSMYFDGRKVNYGDIVTENLKRSLQGLDEIPEPDIRIIAIDSKAEKWLKSKGYDSIYGAKNPMMMSDEFVVIDKSIIKTESQLRKIREEANKKGLKKPVQSDTLVSKSDIMEAERLANLDYENNMSNPERIQSIAIGKEKQFKEFMKKLSKEGKVNPFTLESDIKMVKEGVLGERASKNILEERDKYISKQTKSPSTTKSETPSLKTAPSKELQPLYEEAMKYKSAEEFAKGLKNEDDMKAKILMDGFNERYKNRSFEDMLPKGIEYTPYQLSFLKSRVEPNMQLSLQDAKSLMNNDKNILDKINKKMGIDMTRNKERGEIFDSQLRKIREGANRK